LDFEQWPISFGCTNQHQKFDFSKSSLKWQSQQQELSFPTLRPQEAARNFEKNYFNF